MCYSSGNAMSEEAGWDGGSGEAEMRAATNDVEVIAQRTHLLVMEGS